MATGLQDHARGALEHLRCDLEGDRARQAHHHAAVGHRLDHDVHERGARAAQAGDGVHQLVLDLDAATDGLEQARRRGDLGVGDPLAAGEHRHALTDEARRVRHGADHRRLRQPLGELGERDPGGDADDELAGQRLAHAGLVHDLGDPLRLQGQQHGLRGAAGREVVERDGDAVARLHGVGGVLATGGREQLARGEQPGAQQPADDRLTHDPAADDGQSRV